MKKDKKKLGFVAKLEQQLALNQKKKCGSESHRTHYKIMSIKVDCRDFGCDGHESHGIENG